MMLWQKWFSLRGDCVGISPSNKLRSKTSDCVLILVPMFLGLGTDNSPLLNLDMGVCYDLVKY